MRARVWRSVWRVVCGVVYSEYVVLCSVLSVSLPAGAAESAPGLSADNGNGCGRVPLSLLWRGRVRYHGRVKINNA